MKFKKKVALFEKRIICSVEKTRTFTQHVPTKGLGLRLY